MNQRVIDMQTGMVENLSTISSDCRREIILSSLFSSTMTRYGSDSQPYQSLYDLLQGSSQFTSWSAIDYYFIQLDLIEIENCMDIIIIL